MTHNDMVNWQSRINNLLDVQKDLGLELITVTFTRKELVELRIMVNTLLDLEGSESE